MYVCCMRAWVRGCARASVRPCGRVCAYLCSCVLRVVRVSSSFACVLPALMQVAMKALAMGDTLSVHIMQQIPGGEAVVLQSSELAVSDYVRRSDLGIRGDSVSPLRVRVKTKVREECEAWLQRP